MSFHLAISRALLDQFGIMGLQGKKLGLWDYTLVENGITEIIFEIGIMGFQSNAYWDFQIRALPIRGFH